jgi:hypothetical protein
MTNTRNTVLKMADHDENKEIDFEISYLLSLSVKERFELMIKRTTELLNLFEKNGHRRTPEIIKRT